MKKSLAFILLLLNFLVLPNSLAKEEVVIDRITQAEAEDLDIVIPDNVPPGHHSFTIEVYDDKGTVSKKEIPFCKDNDGIVQWDDNCPNLVLPTDPVPVEPVKINESTSGLKSYDPMKDPETTKNLQLAAFAVLASLAAAKREEKKSDEEQDQEQESLQSVSSGALKLLKNEPGWGDLSKTWRSPLTSRSDSFFIALSHRFNGISPLLIRTVQDGNTLRAIVGSISSLLIPTGLILGVMATSNVNNQALPPTWTIVAAIMAVAIFDAFAGFLAGSIFFVATLFTGNITTRAELLTAVGVLVLCFAPALLASAFRPFRRLIRNQDDLWERITDYALGALLTFWVVTKMVAAMNGLAHLQLPITSHGTQLGIIAAVLLAARLTLEDISVEHYPMRLRELHVEIKPRTYNEKIRSLIYKVIVFQGMAVPFVESALHLALGSLLFVIPQLSALGLEDKLPKKKLYLPKGVLKTVVMIFVMAFAANLIEGAFSTPEAFLKWSFVVMALPGFFLHYLDAVTDAPQTAWKTTGNGRKIYRIGGVVVFILMALVVKGVDIASWLVG